MRNLASRMILGAVLTFAATLAPVAQAATADAASLLLTGRTRARSEGDRAAAARLRLLHRSVRLGQRGRPAHRRCRRPSTRSPASTWASRRSGRCSMRSATASVACSPQQLREHTQLQPVITLSPDGRTARAPLACAGAAGTVPGIRALADRSVRERIPQGERRLEDQRACTGTRPSPCRSRAAGRVACRSPMWRTARFRRRIGRRSCQLRALARGAPAEVRIHASGARGRDFGLGGVRHAQACPARRRRVELARLQQLVTRLEDEREIEILQRTYGYYVDKNLWTRDPAAVRRGRHARDRRPRRVRGPQARAAVPRVAGFPGAGPALRPHADAAHHPRVARWHAGQGPLARADLRRRLRRRQHVRRLHLRERIPQGRTASG